MIPSFRRALAAAVVATAALAATAPAALGATLVNSGGTLTYTGTGADNDVSFERTAPNQVRVVRDTTDDTDAISATGCATETTPGTDYTCDGVDRVVANGGAGDDVLDGFDLDEIPTTMNGGDGDDALDSGDAGSTLNGDAGGDRLASGIGNDILNGGDGTDALIGDDGDDTLNGGSGSDTLADIDGNDTVRGDAGDDTFLAGLGADDISGGEGYDTMLTLVIGGPTPRPSTLVSLNDVADDQMGAAGEGDNVRSDVEGVSTEFDPILLLFLGGGGGTFPPSNDTLIGSAAANTLASGEGDDTVDGGTGNDVLSGGAGSDTVRARDGFFDFVNCGAGADTAEVDTLDKVEECETVQRADVGNANDVPEDRSPTVVLTGPAPSALLRTNGPTVLTADASDDKGIATVLFLDDDRIVCADTAAPYTCDYQPRGEDVGRNTLVAVAVDTAQQTASTTRAFSVDRFTVAGITGAVTPARDLRAPFVFRTAGRLRLPPFVTAALGCADGQVSIQVKAGSKTISTRRADLRRDCSFSSTVRFADRSRFTRNGRLRFTLRFTGNEVLGRSAAVARNVRTRR